MLTVQLPIPFFKKLAENLGYTEVWIRWIIQYGDKIKDPFFMDWLNKKEKPRPDEFEALKKIYHMGEPFLQAFSFGKTKKETKKARLTAADIDFQARRVLNYLNLKMGVEYGKVKIEPVLKPIKAILQEGYAPLDCKHVIDVKYQQWYGTEQQIYLRPSTLFNPKKFEEYLNQPILSNAARKESPGSHIEQIHDTVKQAIELNHKMGGDQAREANH